MREWTWKKSLKCLWRLSQVTARVSFSSNKNTSTGKIYRINFKYESFRMLFLIHLRISLHPLREVEQCFKAVTKKYVEWNRFQAWFCWQVDGFESVWECAVFAPRKSGFPANPSLCQLWMHFHHHQYLKISSSKLVVSTALVIAIRNIKEL